MAHYVGNNPVNYVDPTGHFRALRLLDGGGGGGLAPLLAMSSNWLALNGPDAIETAVDLKDVIENPSVPGLVAVGADVLAMASPAPAKLDGPPSAKRPPNPYGKAGSPAHQAKVQDVAADIASRGLEPEFEYLVKTPNGHKPYRYADVVAKDAQGNVVEIHQVGRVTKSGWAVSRELKAMRDIQEAKGIYVRFHEYQW